VGSEGETDAKSNFTTHSLREHHVMKHFTLKKKIAAGAAIVALGIGAGSAAFAFWSSTGSGTGAASTTVGSSDLSYSQNTLDAMYPGDASQVLTVTVTNDQPSGGQNEHVGGVAAYITTDKALCTGADFLLGGVTAPSTLATAASLTFTATDLAPGDTADATSTVQFKNTTSNQDACKNAAVTLHYSS
jgi:hypothetical protein